MSRYRRERSPDLSTDEPRSRFFTLLRNGGIERRTGEQVFAHFESVREKFSMDGDTLEWVIPAAYVAAVAKKNSSEPSTVQLSVLLKCTALSITQFFNRLRKWIEVYNSPPTARESISQSERYFQMSKNLFDRYEQIFASVFKDPADPGTPRTIERSSSSRKKKPNLPKNVQPIDLFIFTWDLFVRIRYAATAIRDDLVSCYHLLLCVVDLVSQNVLHLKRRDLFNEECTVIPPEIKQEPVDEASTSSAADSGKPPSEAAEKIFSLLPHLCAHFEGLYADCKIMFSKVFIPIMDNLVEENELVAERTTLLGLLTPQNYDLNLASVNQIYDEFVRSSQTVDERVLLVTSDMGNPVFGGDPGNPIDVVDLMKERRRGSPVKVRKFDSCVDFRTPRPISYGTTLPSPSPLTPSSNCSALERREAQESVKSPAVSTAVDLVSRLTAMVVGRINAPSPNLTSVLKSLYGKDVSDDFVKLSAACRELMVTAYVQNCDTRLAEPFIRQRFVTAETWFFKLLEDILVSEKARSPHDFGRVRRLVDCEKFQKSLFALAIEMILYCYNSSRMFPWPLETLHIQPYDFVKVIEPVVRLERLPSQLVRHLARIEETVLEQLVWKSDSLLWDDIKAHGGVVHSVRDVNWKHNLEEQPTIDGTEEPKDTDDTTSSSVSIEAAKPKRTPKSGGRKPSEEPSTSKENVELPPETSPDPDADTTIIAEPPVRPNHGGALNLFLRKVYQLAANRLRELCHQLDFTAEIERERHIFQRMFTLFEYVLTKNTWILKDRHLDQMLLCCAYVCAKLETNREFHKTFHQIMHAYRFQPQAESRVYRSVLICAKPTVAPVTHQHDTRRKAQAVTQTGAEGESGEIRQDIISFYNQVFVSAIQGFIVNFSQKKKGGPTPVALSPVPRTITHSGIRRQVHPAGKVYVSPLKRERPPSPHHDGRVLTFTFGVSGEQQEALLAAANSLPFSLPSRVPKYPLKRSDSVLSDGLEVKKLKPDPDQPPKPKTPTTTITATTEAADVPDATNAAVMPALTVKENGMQEHPPIANEPSEVTNIAANGDANIAAASPSTEVVVVLNNDISEPALPESHPEPLISLVNGIPENDDQTTNMSLDSDAMVMNEVIVGNSDQTSSSASSAMEVVP